MAGIGIADRAGAAGPIGGGLQGSVGSTPSTGVPPPPAAPVGQGGLPLIGQAIQGANNPPPPPPAPPAPASPPPAGSNDPRSNEPLPKQLATNAVPWTSGLVHGYMRTLAGQNQGGAGDFFVYFLFNPLQIQQQYGFTNALVPQIVQPATDPNAPGASNPDIAAQSGAFQNQSITFQIEFDRTYDVWEFMIANGRGSEGRPFGPDSPGRAGVMWDIRAIERLLGLYDSVVTNADGKANPQAPSGQAISPAVDVFFGGPGALSFRGYFTALDAELQRFNQYMVPVHAAVTMTLARVYQPPDGMPTSTPDPALTDTQGQNSGGTTTASGVIGDGITGAVGSITGGLKGFLGGGK